MSDGNSGFNAVFGGGGGGGATINRTNGSFSLQNDITITIPLLPTAIAYSSIDLSDGISPASDGTINFSVEGIYMVNVTYNFAHISLLTADFGYVWYQLSGVDVPESNRIVTFNQNIKESTLSVSYMVKIGALMSGGFDTIQLFFTATSTDILLFYDNGTSPKTSSVNCNVFQIA